MKYLFFDLESANEHTGIGGICSFGYVLCDNDFNVLETDDIIINPELKRWDKYALNNILPYSRECYESMSPFPKAFPRIKELFEIEDLIVINHAIGNDIILLTQTCKRYNIDFVHFNYYDSSELYRKYKNRKNHDNLDNISKEVCGLEERTSHSSQDDANRVFNIIKTLCFNENLGVKELFDKYNQALRNTSDINELDIIDFNNNELHNSSNSRLFYRCLRKEKTNNNPTIKYKGLKYSINTTYENDHFKEMLYIINMASQKGLSYSRKIDDSDIFVIIKGDEEKGRYGHVLNTIKKGKSIKIIDIDEFFNMIDFNQNDVINYFYKVMEKYSYLKLINDKKV